MEFQESNITFASDKGGPRSGSANVAFSKTVTKATAVLTGIDISYSGSDHHLGQIITKVKKTAINANNVEVTATLGLRDYSGNWDDAYGGVLYFAVIAELGNEVELENIEGFEEAELEK